MIDISVVGLVVVGDEYKKKRQSGGGGVCSPIGAKRHLGGHHGIFQFTGDKQQLSRSSHDSSISLQNEKRDKRGKRVERQCRLQGKKQGGREPSKHLWRSLVEPFYFTLSIKAKKRGKTKKNPGDTQPGTGWFCR